MQHKEQTPKPQIRRTRWPGESNNGWMAKESDEAKRLRGMGHSRFRRLIIAERGNVCEVCRYDARDQISYLHIHHLLKRNRYRELAFERSNVRLCCQECHVELEKFSNQNRIPTHRDMVDVRIERSQVNL